MAVHYWRGVMPQTPALRIRYREWSVFENLKVRMPGLLADHYSPAHTLRVSVKGAPSRSCSYCGELGYVRGSRGGGGGGGDGIGASGAAARGDFAQTPSVSVGSDGLMPATLATRAASSVELPGGSTELSEQLLRSHLGDAASRAHLIHFDSLRPDATGFRVKLDDKSQSKFDDTIRALGTMRRSKLGRPERLTYSPTPWGFLRRNLSTPVAFLRPLPFYARVFLCPCLPMNVAFYFICGCLTSTCGCDVFSPLYLATLAAGGGFCCVEPERRGAHMHFWCTWFPVLELGAEARATLGTSYPPHPPSRCSHHGCV